jgi:hypothetical protein
LCVDARGIEFALFDNRSASIVLEPAEEAASISLVADSGSESLDAQEERVGIAIDAHLAQFEDVAALLPLPPQLISSTAKKDYFTSPPRFLECLGIHEAEHQYFARGRILDDDRKQTAAFVESEFHIPSKMKKPAGTFAPAG